MKSRNSAIKVLLAVLFVSSFGFYSCKKEYFEMDRVKDSVYNPTFAIPLVSSTITVPEVLDRFDDDDVIVIDSTGILALKYFRRFFSLPASQFFALNNQSQAAGYPLTVTDIATLGTGGSVTASPSFTYTMDLSNLATTPELTEINFKGGTLDLNMTSQHSYPTNIRIRIPALANGFGSYDQTFNNITVTNPVTSSTGLAGYRLDLTQGPSGFNEVEVLVDVTINPGGAGTAGQAVNVDFGLNNLDFSLIRGDLKQQQVTTGIDTTRIRFFENYQSGDIFWSDPRLKLIFTNSYGADVEINMNSFFAYSRDFGNIPISGPLDNPVVIASNPGVGLQEVTTVDINRTNSNIVTVASFEPQKVIYDVTGTTNPSGPANNWLLDTSTVVVDMEAYLPFHGRADDWMTADTVPLELFNGDVNSNTIAVDSGGIVDSVELISITIRIVMDNGFPADGYAQIYFYDSTFSATNLIPPIDSLFDNARAVVFASPVPDQNGIVDQNNKKRTIVDVVIDEEKFNRLRLGMQPTGGIGKMVSVGWIETYNQGQTEVKIFKDYTLDLNIGMKIEFKANVNL